MGAIHVTAAIRNPANPDKVWEGLFLVDSGAIDSLVPRDHLEGTSKNALFPRLRRQLRARILMYHLSLLSHKLS